MNAIGSAMDEAKLAGVMGSPLVFFGGDDQIRRKARYDDKPLASADWSAERPPTSARRYRRLGLNAASDGITRLILRLFVHTVSDHSSP
jgi:hypothetical protein